MKYLSTSGVLRPGHVLSVAGHLAAVGTEAEAKKAKGRFLTPAKTGR
jgi:hypothetical protein